MNKSNLSRVLMAAIATAMVGIAAPAFADSSPEDIQRFVKMCDENKDGMISKAEIMKRAESMGGLKRAMIATTCQGKLMKAEMALGKNPVEAMNLAEQVLSDDPKNAQALPLLAKAADAAKLPETVLQTLEHLTKLNPRDTKSLHWLARAYNGVGKHDMARDVYERILQSNPNDFDAQKGAKDATAHGAMAEGKWEEDGTFHDKLKDKGEADSMP